MANLIGSVTWTPQQPVAGESVRIDDQASDRLFGSNERRSATLTLYPYKIIYIGQALQVNNAAPGAVVTSEDKKLTKVLLPCNCNLSARCSRHQTSTSGPRIGIFP
jgi:hypothetical protein